MITIVAYVRKQNKLGLEKKHINSKGHEELSDSVNNSYYVISPEHDEIENVLKQYANNHYKRFGLFL